MRFPILKGKMLGALLDKKQVRYKKHGAPGLCLTTATLGLSMSSCFVCLGGTPNDAGSGGLGGSQGSVLMNYSGRCLGDHKGC